MGISNKNRNSSQRNLQLDPNRDPTSKSNTTPHDSKRIAIHTRARAYASPGF